MTDQDPITTPSESFTRITLTEDDQYEYDQLGLPQAHPHVFAKALQFQLDRLPLLELDQESAAGSQAAYALFA